MSLISQITFLDIYYIFFSILYYVETQDQNEHEQNYMILPFSKKCIIFSQRRMDLGKELLQKYTLNVYFLCLILCIHEVAILKVCSIPESKI